MKNLILILLSLNIQAFDKKVANLSYECDESVNFYNVIQLDSKSQYITCDKIYQYDRIISRIAEIAPYAPKVSLIIHRSSGNASFDYGGNISIPHNLVFTGKFGHKSYGSHFKIASIFAHEYGHAVFTEELKKKDYFKKFYTYSRRISYLRVKGLLAYTNMNRGNMIQIAAKSMDILSERRKETDFIAMRKFVTAYNELYADIIATYLNGHKSDIFEALYHEELNDRQYKALQARSFSNTNDWDDFYHTPHSLFARTRNYIGQEFWPTNDEDKKSYLKLILSAIMEEIDQKHEKHKDFNAKKLNDDLISRLEKIRKKL